MGTRGPRCAPRVEIVAVAASTMSPTARKELWCGVFTTRDYRECSRARRWTRYHRIPRPLDSRSPRGDEAGKDSTARSR